MTFNAQEFHYPKVYVGSCPHSGTVHNRGQLKGESIRKALNPKLAGGSTQERETEREREADYIHIYIYICIW